MTGKELEDIRKKIGWSKRELAKRLGVTDVTIFNYTKRDFNIPTPIENLMKIYEEKFGEV